MRSDMTAIFVIILLICLAAFMVMVPFLTEFMVSLIVLSAGVVS